MVTTSCRSISRVAGAPNDCGTTRSYWVKPGKSWGILLNANKQVRVREVYLSRARGVREAVLAYTVTAFFWSDALRLA
jgi:hypothetical protein